MLEVLALALQPVNDCVFPGPQLARRPPPPRIQAYIRASANPVGSPANQRSAARCFVMAEPRCGRYFWGRAAREAPLRPPGLRHASTRTAALGSWWSPGRLPASPCACVPSCWHRRAGAHYNGGLSLLAPVGGGENPFFFPFLPWAIFNLLACRFILSSAASRLNAVHLVQCLQSRHHLHCRPPALLTGPRILAASTTTARRPDYTTATPQQCRDEYPSPP